MANVNLNMKALNEALNDLHHQAQDASSQELENIANQYMKLVNNDAFRNYLYRLFRNKSRDLAKEDLEDCFQDICLKLSAYIKSGKLPAVLTSGSGYFITAYKHYLISFVEKNSRIRNTSLLDYDKQLIAEKPKPSSAINRRLYDLENLKSCFFSLFFLLDKIDPNNFKHYCARLSFLKDDDCARTVAEMEEDEWEEVDKTKKREVIQDFKNKMKSIDYKASNLFNSQTRQVGFFYQNRDFSERKSKELTNTSGIIKGIMWHFYINEDAIANNVSITKAHQANLIKKMKLDQSILGIDGKSPIRCYFDFEQYLFATLTVYQKLDDAGKGINYQHLLQELIKEENQNQDFLDQFRSALEYVITKDNNN